MNNQLSRRDFMQVAALTAGGAALAGACSSPASQRGAAPAFDPNDSYWALEQPPANPPLAEDMAVDVAIVGGGYTGLSAAWHLAQAAPGLKIAVLEALQVGHGASGRHGGMMPLELWDEDETAAALGTEIYAGGVFDPNGGSVHAIKLVKALKSAVEAAGVHIFGDSPVLDMEEGQPVAPSSTSTSWSRLTASLVC